MPSGELLQTEARVLELLRARDLRGAVETVVEYERTRPHARGIGIDWSRYDVAADTRRLHTIFYARPTALDGITAEAYEQASVAAAMMLLFGNGRPRRSWVPREAAAYTRFSLDQAARLIVFFARGVEVLSSYRTWSVPVRVRVSSSTDCCLECARLQKQTWEIGDAPELPLAACSSADGCRCCYASVVQ